MNVRYLLLLVIPAFFALSGCASKPHVQPEGFFDFTSDIEPKKIEVAKPKPVEKAAPKTKEIVEEQKPEEAPVAKEKPVTTDITKASKRFNLGYLTFDVADFYGEVIPLDKNDDYTRYQFRFYSRTNGFVDYLFGWMSHTISIMRVYDDKVVPEKFRTKGILKKKTREIALDYDSSGRNLVTDKVTPPDNRGKRPAVKDSMKVGTYDPLSIAMEARRIIMKAFKDNSFTNNIYSFSLPLYDGRRRSDINFELENKKYGANYHVKIKQKPLEGYTENEWNDLKKGERIIDIYFDSKTFWPTTARGESVIGSARAHFVQDCNMVFEDCIKLSDDKRK